MRIALPILGTRISPVFDTARRLLVVDAESGEELGREEARLTGLSPYRRAELLHELGAQVLICCAISTPLLWMVRRRQVEVVPHTVGNMDEVVRAYLTNELGRPCFMMPGCCGRQRRRRFRGGQPGLSWRRTQ